MKPKEPKPDNKCRLSQVDSQKSGGACIEVEKHAEMVIPDPLSKIPENERWLYKNKEALKQVQQGLKDAKEGRIKYNSSFTKYIDDDDE